MAFATAADLAKRLQRTFDASDTDNAELLLDLATAAIQDYTRQTLERVTDDDVVLHGTWSDRIALPERPVIAVSAVSIDGTALTATGYTWEHAGRLTRWGGWGGPSVEVAVTYTHGFDPIPDGLRRICLEVAARAFANPSGILQESVAGYSATYAGGGVGGGIGVSLTESEERALRRYRPGVL